MKLSLRDFESSIPQHVGSVRVIHSGECFSESVSKSRSLKIERKSDGTVSAVCFRCGGSYWSRDTGFRFSEEVGIPRGHDKPDSGFPSDITRVIDHWDSTARVWIGRAGVTQAHCDRYAIGYSPIARRVIIPVGDGSVQRGFGTDARYCIQGQVDEFFATPKSDTSAANHTIVITEDCLSAIRVADAGYHAVALLGTYLKASTWMKLSVDLGRGYTRFVVWLDDDNHTVRLAQTRIGQRLSQIGLMRVVRGHREPKLLTDSDISDIVRTHTHFEVIPK